MQIWSRGEHRCGGEGNTDVDEREIKMLRRGRHRCGGEGDRRYRCAGENQWGGITAGREESLGMRNKIGKEDQWKGESQCRGESHRERREPLGEES
jgi:hypothetical protein